MYCSYITLLYINPTPRHIGGVTHVYGTHTLMCLDVELMYGNVM
jgi:hypothetical protein